MKIIFFTDKSIRGAKILGQMRSTKIPIEAIIIDTGRKHLNRLTRKLKSTWKRLGWLETSKLILNKLKAKWMPTTRRPRHSDEFYQSYSDKVYRVDDLNGSQCEQLLKQIQPDLIVLGSARIIRKNIIRIPKIGILNAHPALLPRYRGVDVIPWSVLHGDDVGVTIHFIDEGIDTGAIVAQKVIELQKGDTIGRLMKRANKLAAEMMSAAILELMETGHLQTMPQSKGAGKQFYRMSSTMRQQVEQKLSDRIAKSNQETT